MESRAGEVTSLALRPDTIKILEHAIREAGKVSRIVEVHPLQTPEDEHRAGALLREIAKIEGELDGARKVEKAPFLKAGRDVDAAFKPALAELARVSGMLRERLQEAITAREHARLAGLRAASLAAQSGDVVGANTALAHIPIDVETKGIAERWDWTPEAVRLKEVPEEFLALDMARVKAYTRDCVARDVEPSIPGIVFKKIASIAVRKAE